MSDTAEIAPPVEFRRVPNNDIGIYLYSHKHDWHEIGAHQWPSGEWVPVFGCGLCPDVICNDAVEVPLERSAPA